MNVNEIAARLCERAERLGLDNPTEDMISNCLLDVVCNTLNFPIETAAAIPGCEDSTVMKMRRLLGQLSGPLAESVAHDMDHKQKDHSKWYKAVESARDFLKKNQP